MREAIWSKASTPASPTTPSCSSTGSSTRRPRSGRRRTPTETKWGEWAADVERPPAQYRGIATSSASADARPLLIGLPACADTVAPLTQVSAPAEQKALKRHGVRVSVSCPAETCTADVRARVLLGQRPKLAAPLATLRAGQARRSGSASSPAYAGWSRGPSSDDQRVRVDVTVTTTDPAGNTSVATQRVRITG